MRRLLDYDPLSGVYTYHHYDAVDDVTTIERVQDVQGYLEVNRALAKDGDYSRKGIKENWWHAARIPVMVQERWLKEKGINIYDKGHWPAVRRLLNDPEWRYLKTTTGRV